MKSIFHPLIHIDKCQLNQYYILLLHAVSSKPHLDLSLGILLWSTDSQQPLLMHHKNMEKQTVECLKLSPSFPKFSILLLSQPG